MCVLPMCFFSVVVFGFRFSVSAMKTHSKEAEVVFYRCLFAIRGELRVRFSDFSVYLCDSVFPAAGFQLVAIYMYVCVLRKIQMSKINFKYYKTLLKRSK